MQRLKRGAPWALLLFVALTLIGAHGKALPTATRPEHPGELAAIRIDLKHGQRASLDALCERFDIDNSNRTKHGALLIVDAVTAGAVAPADLDLVITELASPEAGKIALKGGSADLIVSDVMWVARERAVGGSLLYYQGIRAGEVLGYELANDYQSVLIHAFVSAPYDRMVRSSTRFWTGCTR